MEKQLESRKKLSENQLPDLSFETKARNLGYENIAGVDEAGRGPLAGPVVVAAVVLTADLPCELEELNDSKKLTEKKRERLFGIIKKNVRAYRIQVISAKIIDQINILQATFLGMKQVIQKMSVEVNYILVDGNQYPFGDFPGEPIVRGDSQSLSIAAASVLAKVTRDRIMVGYDKRYPQWDFKKHKGYPTKNHRDAVHKFGLSPIHRRSFHIKKDISD